MRLLGIVLIFAIGLMAGAAFKPDHVVTKTVHDPAPPAKVIVKTETVTKTVEIPLDSHCKSLIDVTGQLRKAAEKVIDTGDHLEPLLHAAQVNIAMSDTAGLTQVEKQLFNLSGSTTNRALSLEELATRYDSMKGLCPQ